MGFIAKLTRSSMLEQNNSDYVKMARAKGIGRWTIVFRHTLRNALLPVVTYLGPLTAGVVTGSFIVEQIFAIPDLVNTSSKVLQTVTIQSLWVRQCSFPSSFICGINR